MLLHVVLARLVGMMRGMGLMPVSCVGMVRGLFMIAPFMMVRRGQVMLGRMLVVFGCLSMVLGCFFRHGNLLLSMLTANCDAPITPP